MTKLKLNKMKGKIELSQMKRKEKKEMKIERG
jgi:hypothetical protein